MNLGRLPEKMLLSLGLILLFISPTVGFIKEYSYLSDYLFRFGGFLIIIIAFKTLIDNEWFMNKFLKRFTFLYGVFISMMILSIIVNQSLEVELSTLETFSLAFLFLGVLLSITEVSERLIINSLIISLGVIFIYFLIEFPISENTTNGYRGGLSNSNTFGNLAVVLFSVSIVAVASQIRMKRNFALASVYLLIAISAAYLTTISASRTAFVSLVILLAIVSLTLIYDELKKRKLLTLKSILFTLLIAVVGISLFVLIDNPIYSVIDSNILDKFSKKIEAGSITDGRIDIWQRIIEEVGFFGTVNFFEDDFYVHAHNSFMQIVTKFGWLTGIAYVIFWLAMFIKAVHYYVTEKITNPYAILPLIVISNFILLSMTSLLQFHIGTFLAMSMLAIFSKSKESKLDFEI